MFENKKAVEVFDAVTNALLEGHSNDETSMADWTLYIIALSLARLSDDIRELKAKEEKE